MIKTSGWKNHAIYLFVFTLLAILLLLLSFQYHVKRDKEQWKQENYADAGGYFAYNLIWFEYGYTAANYPSKIDSALGKGFTIETPVIKDKYTCGVAYLQAPFYLVNKQFTPIKNRHEMPTSSNIRRAIDVAGIFYLWLGAVCLYFFMVKYYKPWISFITILFIVAGTNVFFYAVYHPGMSHIYSFFLFSAYLLLGSAFIDKKKKWMLVLMSLVGATIVLIRPTDILFLPSILFIRGSFKENIRLFIKPFNLLISIVMGILVFIPQMNYWYQYSGQLLYYSYTNEGFTHLLNPRLAEVLFAPDNGLFPYSLILIVLLSANVYAILKKQAYAIYFLVYQLLTLYLIASWHIPQFGGGYGQRNFVEVFAGYSIIMAYMINGMITAKKSVRLYIIFSFSILVSAINLKIISKYDHVFFGRNIWDWREYAYFINFNSYSTHETFSGYYRTDNLLHEPGGNKVLNILPSTEFSRTLLFDYKELPAYYKHGLFSMDIKSNEKKVEFYYCIRVALEDSVIDTKMAVAQDKSPSNVKWRKLKGDFILNFVPDIPKESKVIVYIWNIQHQKFMVDNVKLCIE